MGHILYIEDNIGNRMLVRRVLEAEGYNLIEATDGPAGLEMATQDTPDLILLDINLPGIDGYDLAKRFRDINSLDGIPILAVTANVMKEDRDACLEAGMDDYLGKPFRVKDLVAALSKAQALA